MNSEKFIKVCTILIINFFRAHSDKLRLYGAGAAFFARSRSGPNLAGVSSGNSDFRSRLLNTEFYSHKIYGYRYQQYVLARHTTFVSHASFCMLETGNLQCLFKKRELKEKCIRVEWYQ